MTILLLVAESVAVLSLQSFLTSGPFLALMGAIFGGVGLKLVEWLLTRKDRSDQLAIQLRKELRHDLDDARETLEECRGRKERLRNERTELKHELNHLQIERLHARDIIRTLVDECNTDEGLTIETIIRAKHHMKVYPD